MSDFTLQNCSIYIGTLLSFDSNIKKPILVPETPIISTKLLLAMKYQHYSYDRRTVFTVECLKIAVKMKLV